jgi:hypothetical protein
MSQQPRVFSYNPTGVVRSQYDVWGPPEGYSGWDALMITRAGDAAPARLAAAFDAVHWRGEVLVPLGADRRLAFHVWHGVRLSAWPAPAE